MKKKLSLAIFIIMASLFAMGSAKSNAEPPIQLRKVFAYNLEWVYSAPGTHWRAGDAFLISSMVQEITGGEVFYTSVFVGTNGFIVTGEANFAIYADNQWSADFIVEQLLWNLQNYCFPHPQRFQW